ncbi:MAG: MBL fold metallo-hydrolase, partial [Burkholderiales bacterium]
MRVRFWGTRGSIPVSLTWRDVRDRLVTALVAANGRQLDTMEKAHDFVDQHFPFSIRRTYGGHSACVEYEPGS